jgi:hypothetical protein
MTGIELQTLELVDQYRDLERCDPPQPLQRKPTFFDSLVTAVMLSRVRSTTTSSLLPCRTPKIELTRKLPALELHTRYEVSIFSGDVRTILFPDSLKMLTEWFI